MEYNLKIEQHHYKQLTSLNKETFYSILMPKRDLKPHKKQQLVSLDEVGNNTLRESTSTLRIIKVVNGEDILPDHSYHSNR